MLIETNEKRFVEKVRRASESNWAPLPIDTALQLRQTLVARKPEILESFARESGYPIADCLVLWNDLTEFLVGWSGLETLGTSLADAELLGFQAISRHASVRVGPWGTILVCLPANAPLPLAAALPLALAATGNTVVVAASRRTRATSHLLLESCAALLGERLIVWDGPVRSAIKCCLAERLIDAMYFLGGSSLHPDLACQCASAGVHLIYEGEGNSVAIVDHPIGSNSLGSAVEAIHSAKHFCFGQMCSAPNAIVVHETIFTDFKELFHRAAADNELPTSLGHISPQAAAYLRTLEADGAAPFDETVHHACLVEGAALEVALARELFCPAAFLVPFGDWQNLCQTLRKASHRLQVSLFTDSQERAEELISRTRFARFCVNMCPVEQNPLLPWGNYGVSGQSSVLDFRAKGLRRFIVESSFVKGVQET